MRKTEKGGKVNMLDILQRRSSVWLTFSVCGEEICSWKELKMSYGMFNIYCETRNNFLGIVIPQFFLPIKSVKSQRRITK